MDKNGVLVNVYNFFSKRSFIMLPGGPPRRNQGWIIITGHPDARLIPSAMDP